MIQIEEPQHAQLWTSLLQQTLMSPVTEAVIKSELAFRDPELVAESEPDVAATILELVDNLTLGVIARHKILEDKAKDQVSQPLIVPPPGMLQK